MAVHEDRNQKNSNLHSNEILKEKNSNMHSMEILKEKKTELYISDADLLFLIRETEEEGLIRAPHYLKEEIQRKCSSKAMQMSVERKKLSARLQLFLYGLKVTAAMAGAVCLLAVINPDASFIRVEMVPKPPENRISNILYTHSNTVSDALERFSYRLINW